MKRVISLVLVLVLVLGTIMPAFAQKATTVSSEAQELLNMKVLAGTENGLAEGEVLTRAQATVILSDLYGMKAEAKAWALGSSFTDVAADMWYTPYIGFAENKKWMTGKGNGIFAPNATMSAQELNAMFLKVLGYDVKWEEVNAKATELKIAVVAKDSTLVLRGEAFKTLRMLLDTPKKDETATLGTALAIKGYKSPVAPTPAKLEVVSIKSLNLYQLEVVFNQEVDKATAEKTGNYSLTKVTAGSVKAANASIKEDATTVVLTLDKAAAQQDSIDVTVKNVKTAKNVVLKEVKIEGVQFLDMEIPTALSAEVVGKDTIKIVLSEPIKTAKKAGFKVNNGKLYIKGVKLQNNNTEVLVELYSTLKEGDVTIKINSDVVDFAGFGVVGKEFTIPVSVDTTAPVVVGYEKASATGVTLIWSEDIELVSGTASNFYHTNSSNPVAGVVKSSAIDGNKLKLDFTGKELPKGTAYVYVLKKSVKDLWDNKNDQEMLVVEVEIDVTAPAIEGDIKSESEDKITVNFTEDLKKATAEKEANYKILDSKGKVVKVIKKASYTPSTASDSAKVVIDFTKKLSGDYVLVIENVEDLAGNEIADDSVEFTVDDSTRPDPTDFRATIYKKGLKDQMIKVKFGEVMKSEGTYSVLDLANYEINGTLLADFKKDHDITPTITLVDDGKAVEIRITGKTTGTSKGKEINASKITVSRVADFAGNYTLKNSYDVPIVGQGTVKIDKVVATKTNKVVVTFKDELVAFDAKDFVITTSNTNIVAATAAQLKVSEYDVALNSKGQTVVTFTLADTALLNYDAKYNVTNTTASAIYAYVIDKNSKNIYDETVDKTNNELASDEIVPVLAQLGNATKYDNVIASVTTGTTIVLTFAEDMKIETFNTLTFKVGNGDFKVESIDFNGTKNVLTLTIKNDDEKSLVDVTVVQQAAVADNSPKRNQVTDIDTVIHE